MTRRTRAWRTTMWASLFLAGVVAALWIASKQRYFGLYGAGGYELRFSWGGVSLVHFSEGFDGWGGFCSHLSDVVGSYLHIGSLTNPPRWEAELPLWIPESVLFIAAGIARWRSRVNRRAEPKP